MSGYGPPIGHQWYETYRQVCFKTFQLGYRKTIQIMLQCAMLSPSILGNGSLKGMEKESNLMLNKVWELIQLRVPRDEAFDTAIILICRGRLLWCRGADRLPKERLCCRQGIVENCSITTPLYILVSCDHGNRQG